MSRTDTDLERFKRLFDTVMGEPTPHKQAVELHATRQREIEAVLTYAKELQEKQRRRTLRQSRWLMISALLAAAGVVNIALESINITVIGSWDTGVMGRVLGLAGLSIGGLTLLVGRSRNPIGKLQRRLTQLYRRMTQSSAASAATRSDTKRVLRRLDRSSKRLYKRKNGRLVAGVGAGLAYYTRLPVGLIRFLMVMGLFFSAGTAIVLYFLLAVLLPEPPFEEDEG